MRDHGPCAPAMAYAEMVEIVGEVWFTERPPLVGTSLRVVGLDDQVTEWSLTDAHARLVAEKVRDNPHLRLLSRRKFALVYPS